MEMKHCLTVVLPEEMAEMPVQIIKGVELQKDGDSVVADLTSVNPGTYTLKAGVQEVKFQVLDEGSSN